LTGFAQTATESQYNLFRLTSEASVDVANDLMIATLVVQDEDKDPAALADKINSKATWANNVLRPYATITFTSRDYQTYPRYDSSQVRRLIGWRAAQIIELETDDFEAAGKAIQKLQEKLQVQRIRLLAKPTTRAEASDLLITQALNRFKDRARLIQRNMNSAGFKIVEVDINTGQGGMEEYSSRVAMDEMSSRSAVQSEPVIEAGTTRVTVQVYGRIQLD
jgi:predicted secreted protein